jgi:hypothetical protein
VVLMWLSGAAMKLRGHFGGPIDAQGLIAIQLPGAIIGTLQAALTFPLLLSLKGVAQSNWRPALILSALLATEPFLIEQARIGALDIPALGLAWFGMLFSLRAFERASWRDAAAAGLLFGLAILAKVSSAPLPAALMLILVGHSALTRFRDRRGLNVALVATPAALLVTFALWPALWVAPRVTLVGLLGDVRGLAKQGHWHVVDGKRTRDPGPGYYLTYLASVTPVETALLATAGVAALPLVPSIRKHFAWLVLTLIASLIVIMLTPKKLERYVVGAALLFCAFAAAALTWAWQRLQTKLGRAGPAIMAALSLLLVARLARVVALLPSARQCTNWPGRDACGRPSDMYFMREIALLIKQDWRSQGRPNHPEVLVFRVQLMSPWLLAYNPKDPGKADYVVAWDEDFEDAASGRLKKKARRRYGRLGPEVGAVRHEGFVVARVYRTDH